MNFGNEPIFQWLAQYAYQPTVVYVSVCTMMIASAFGFPLPEEISIISVGILAYMGAHPELFAPPSVGSPVVNGYEAALIVSLAVFFSDSLVFFIGRMFGRKLMKRPRFHSFFEGPVMEKINGFVKKYGVYAAFVFRFTPGIRFPAHIVLGMSKFAFAAFLLVDGLAVMISVPTQILLVYHFGEPILGTLYKFKTYVGIALVVVIAGILIKKVWQKFFEAKTSPPSEL